MEPPPKKNRLQTSLMQFFGRDSAVISSEGYATSSTATSAPEDMSESGRNSVNTHTTVDNQSNQVLSMSMTTSTSTQSGSQLSNLSHNTEPHFNSATAGNEPYVNDVGYEIKKTLAGHN